jgi:glycosyl transferase family 25
MSSIYPDILKNVVYINLKEREDRNIHLLKEFEKVDITPTRFEAIKHSTGAIGCTQSHITVLKMALQKGWDYLFVVEDDFTFLDHSQLLKSLENFLLNQGKDSWDVLVIAGNNFPPYEKVNDSYIRIKNCQTTTGYLLHKKYIPILLQNFEESFNKLINTK